MKLRFRKNSLRLRVSQTEVKGLAAGSVLEEQVHFPGNASMSYVLEPSVISAPSASFQQGVIRVVVPRSRFTEWARSADLGIYFDVPANGSSLRVAIEKDLECVDGPVEERDPDAFPRGVEKIC